MRVTDDSFDMVLRIHTLSTNGFHAQLLQIRRRGGPRCLTAQKVALFVENDGRENLFLNDYVTDFNKLNFE